MVSLFDGMADFEFACQAAGFRGPSQPRSETCETTGVLSVWLACMIQKERDYEASSTYYWSDSSAVIGQICGESKRHPAFTANRCSESLDTSDPQQWRQCTGKQNTADEGICRPEGRYNYSRLSRVKWTSIPSILSEDQLPEDIPKSKFAPDVTCKVPAETIIYYINICEIPGFLLFLKNHISTARSEHTIFM